MIFLSDATIAENIAFGIKKSKIDYTRLVEVAAKARLLDVIEAYENKFDTVIGEKGMRLSGGQRQRIAIARALYKDAKILVFDEATSALDDATEGSVMDAISNLQKEITIIMVAHRLTTLRQCNQIVELRNGIISRAGTYQQIINT